MHRLKFFLIVLFAGLSTAAFSQNNDLDERDPVAHIKSSFIFQFAYLSEWPAESREGSEFVIGVYGNDVIYETLVKKYATQPIGKQILKIKNISTIEEAQESHLVFVDKSSESDLKDIIKSLSNSPTMLVSDASTALELGATIAFVAIDSNVRYKLNEKDAKKKSILFGNELKSWEIKD